MTDLLSGAVGGVIVFVLTVLWSWIGEARRGVRARMGYARLLDAEIEANGLTFETLAPLSPWEFWDFAAGSPISSHLEDYSIVTSSTINWIMKSKEEQEAELLATSKIAWSRQLTSEAWREVREPLAPLIKAADFRVLDNYYRRLNWLLTQIIRPREGIQTAPPGIPDVPKGQAFTDKQAEERARREVLISEQKELKHIASALQESTPEVRAMLDKYTNPPRRTLWFGLDPTPLWKRMGAKISAKRD